ncbi:outer membrane beta-barrel protein [Nitrospira sp. T9]|uniref:outer membrane beta-barrel protein n=1 Tax=unclassified Nitrospira TaxID=2652172 RepID=UPI003F95FBC9
MFLSSHAFVVEGTENDKSPVVPSSPPVVGKHKTLEERAHAHENSGVFSQYAHEWYGLAFYGYGDASYDYNFNSPSTGINNLRGFDVGSNAIRLHLAQFVLERKAKNEGNWLNRFGVRLKFNIGSDSRTVGGSNVGNDADFQEHYLQYLAPIGNGINIQIGRINSLIGFEVLESPYNLNYSRSFLFNLGQPFTTVGVRLTYQFNPYFTLSMAAINSVTSQRNAFIRHVKPGDLVPISIRHPKLETALSFTPHESIHVTLYGLYGFIDGPPGTPGGDRIQGGGFIHLEPVPQVELALEAYFANQADSSALSPRKNARWNGVAGYATYEFTPKWSIRLRAELFEDAGGSVTCLGVAAPPKSNVCFGATSNSSAPPVTQTLWETTATLQFQPFPFLMSRLEFRYDKSNQDVFQIGNGSANHQETLALELITLF